MKDLFLTNEILLFCMKNYTITFVCHTAWERYIREAKKPHSSLSL